MSSTMSQRIVDVIVIPKGTFSLWLPTLRCHTTDRADRARCEKQHAITVEIRATQHCSIRVLRCFLRRAIKTSVMLAIADVVGEKEAKLPFPCSSHDENETRVYILMHSWASFTYARKAVVLHHKDAARGPLKPKRVSRNKLSNESRLNFDR